MEASDPHKSSKQPAPQPSPGRWQHLGRALRHRNYRLFFFGQGTSLIGSWMQRTAQAWLVYDLTKSEWLLGVVAFWGQIMTFFVAPFAGVLADRVNRRRLLIVTQTVAMIQAFLLAALTMAGWVQVWHIIALSIMLGLVNAFDVPIRQSFVVEMLESREDLPNAIALNSFLVNGSKLLGPTIAGVLIAMVGEGMAFLLNGLSFLAVIAALFAMTVKPAPRLALKAHPLHNLREGFAYAMGFAPLRAILLTLAAVSVLGMSYPVLMPVIAKEVLHGGPRTLGFLTASGGAGAICGAIYLASRRNARGLGRILAVAGTIFGLGLVAFSFSHNQWLSFALLAVTGFGMMVQTSSSNALLQTIVDDDKRGRVMSLYTVCFMGMGPFGSLLTGYLASRWNASAAIGLGGAACVVVAALFATRLPALGRIVHPVYVRKGLVRESMPGDEAAGAILQQRL